MYLCLVSGDVCANVGESKEEEANFAAASIFKCSAFAACAVLWERLMHLCIFSHFNVEDACFLFYENEKSFLLPTLPLKGIKLCPFPTSFDTYLRSGHNSSLSFGACFVWTAWVPICALALLRIRELGRIRCYCAKQGERNREEWGERVREREINRQGERACKMHLIFQAHVSGLVWAVWMSVNACMSKKVNVCVCVCVRYVDVCAQMCGGGWVLACMQCTNQQLFTFLCSHRGKRCNQKAKQAITICSWNGHVCVSMDTCVHTPKHTHTHAHLKT